MFKRILLILVLFPVSLWAQAPLCGSLFSDVSPVLRHQSKDLLENPQKTPTELLEYSKTKRDFKVALEKLPPHKRQEMEHVLVALEFFDYEHTAVGFWQILLDGQKKYELDYRQSYDMPGEISGVSYRGYTRAREYLMRERPSASPATLLEIHKRIMDDGVEGVTPGMLGQWRDQKWSGHAGGDNALLFDQFLNVSDNRYLHFNERKVLLKEEPYSSFWSSLNIWGAKQSHKKVKEQLIDGIIAYPRIRSENAETLEIIKDSHPELYKTLLETRKLPQDRIPDQLEADYVQALVENRLIQFDKDTQQLGTIEIGKNETRYIDLVADLQRDLVAIHPLNNGNGRSTRLLMNYLLDQKGLPTARLLNPNLDILVSKEEWRSSVQQAVLNSAQLQKDVVLRLQQGIRPETSAELIYPALPERVKVKAKNFDGETLLSEAPVVHDQFGAFLWTLSKHHKEVYELLPGAERLNAINKFADLFVEFYRTKTIRYMQNQHGFKDGGLKLVDADFSLYFNQPTAKNSLKWKLKINRWYDQSTLVWKGLQNSQVEFSNYQILSLFKTPYAGLASKSSARSQNSSPDIVEIQNDFDIYNHALIKGDLPTHLESLTNSKAESSYGLLASTSSQVSLINSTPRGVNTGQIKTRLNIASYKALKDVSLKDLRHVDENSNLTAARDHEVFIVGGVDPEAVVLIQRHGSDGRVLETFYRNPDKPNQILVIRGDFNPLSEKLSDKTVSMSYSY